MRRLLLLLVPLALLAAGCGDDDAEGASDDTTTTAAGDAAEEREEAGDDESADTAPDATDPTDPPADEAPANSVDETDGIDDPGLLLADLDGAAEVPGPGDASGTGRFEAELVDGALCIDMVAEGLDSDVGAAHVHEGAAGAAGAPVLDIGPPTAAEGTTDSWVDVCVPADGALVERIATAPDQFYVNVHTSSFTDGAVRGQLVLGSIFDRRLP